MLDLTDDLIVISSVVDEVRTVSNAIYKYVDDMSRVNPEQIIPDYREELEHMRKFLSEDDTAIRSMSRTISRLCLIINDSLDKVSGALYKIEPPPYENELLKSVVVDELYRGL